jgi:hypothetical protein
VKLIYKYMTFRESYFNHFLLKVSRYGEFNDPFDLVLGEYGSSLSEKDADDFYNIMPDHYKTAEYYNETYLDIQAGARASVAILCFSETFKNILMWSHYAGDHSGLCIGYDASCDFFNSKYSCEYSENVGDLRPIEYTKDRLKFILPDDLVNDTSDWFKKSIDWLYEEEHRILLPMDKAKIIPPDKSETVLPKPKTMWGYRIAPINIKQVILGCRMNHTDKQYICNILAPYDVQILQAKPHPAYYKLKFQAYPPKREVNTIYNLGMDI